MTSALIIRTSYELIFWSILGTGLFFLPMCLLSIVIFDCLRALNPILIVASIFSTFFPYSLVVILFSTPILLMVGMLMAAEQVPNFLLLTIIVRAIGLYLLMVAAGILGRFFYKNEEKLRWDV